jgi:uncharacterized membrane protein
MNDFERMEVRPMMGGMSSMMGPFMGWMMTYWVLVSLLVLIVLGLLAVWLFQQVRRGADGAVGRDRRGYPPASST